MAESSTSPSATLADAIKGASAVAADTRGSSTAAGLNKSPSLALIAANGDGARTSMEDGDDISSSQLVVRKLGDTCRLSLGLVAMTSAHVNKKTYALQTHVYTPRIGVLTLLDNI